MTLAHALNYNGAIMVRFTIRLDEDVHARVSDLAERTNRSRNQYIEHVLSEHIRQLMDQDKRGVFHVPVDSVLLHETVYRRLVEPVDEPAFDVLDTVRTNEG